ncbi:hypothetical protein LTR10_013607 [Elasticomyces elasticus]|uniref:Ecp2 effector protein domain-containing protein n=1 Tax=Exophiala sideris TaxID=1016849 RepID=A0ABR0JQ83_9EURO|nr:hypothetical protein LTR10_013607 [Elasticomyces elasticus]KAK5039746.1 hypothetical protein LTS07_000241 [Exophiala sideris]KAK5041298.1 hypothetical protein LTR13_002773 [Exophiala sideris]KAK5068124.1 hypothetical protein LTR69_000242 [Exophiala sideris]KAK5187425.1 hypothetical protein LTR44_000241 [Eurotiomycetes sp. CCFEE 6388]
MPSHTVLLLLASLCAIVTLAVASDTLAPWDQCIKSTTPVTACQTSDLTTENWASFDIDAFLLDFINQFGTSDNFPKFFVSQQTPTSDPFDSFDCSSFGSTTCTVPQLNNPDVATDCIFDGLEGTFCSNFIGPECGFIIQNYINIWQGLQNHHDAISDAANAITSSGFITTMVQALAPQKQSIALAVFGLIADLVTDILPIGGEIKAATTFMKKIRLIIKATKSDLEDDSGDIVSVVQNNQAIDQEVSATEDQLTQQLANIVSGTQSRLQNILNQIFGANQDPSTIDDESQLSNTIAFQNAQHGMFLDDVPARSDLAAQMQKQMQNWIVSSVLSTMGYDVTVDTTKLDDGDSAPGTVCKAEKGFTAGGGCALFRINGIDHNNGDVIDSAEQGNDIFALQDAGMDIGGMIANAQGCNSGGGGSVDFDDFLDMENTGTLPNCMFNFRVVVTAL